MRHFSLLSATFLAVGLVALSVNSVAAVQPEGDLLPFGTFPHINGTIQENTDPESVGKEVEKLGSRIKDTVKNFASFRNTTCFNSPCLFQAFPLVYTKSHSGFFGGFRAKLTNISRQEPYLYSLETSIIRSDTQQWLTFLYGDFPDISFIPLHPRFKIRGYYSRTTETRFYGTGDSFDVDYIRPDETYRYSLKEVGFTSSLIIPLFRFGNQKINFFSTFSSINHAPLPYTTPTDSKLYTDQPRAYAGGVSSRLGAGLMLDSRDREQLTRTGWSMEVSTEYSRPPLGRYDFQRFTVIDRRYVSKGLVTLASRLTIDGIVGDEPFWELTAVGGVDPVLDVSNSTILRGYPNGRFHEKFKLIENLELRVVTNTVRIFGLLTQFILIPTAVDLARLSTQNAASFTTGSKILFNRNFLVQTYLSFSRNRKAINLKFGEEF